ncbi:MAG: GNAT family N-acetyltransferase [Nanoarchaeota archaeon]|nr:GNAT family N-acetyltransferase [Nanoarchaeota archaeon]MBU1028488.1 GNAT family N-acetyltransferase [Nanoarchaeota archaeon]
MKIKNNDFIVRSPKLSDVNDLWEAYNDEGVSQGMVFPDSEKEFKLEFKKNIKKKPKDSDSLVIEICGKVIGKISLHDIIPTLKGKSSSYLHKDYRNKGIMSKAKKIALNYWFKKYKLRRIYGYCRSYNKASAKSMEKAGYKFEGVIKKNTLKDGKYYDDYLYAVTR